MCGGYLGGGGAKGIPLSLLHLCMLLSRVDVQSQGSVCELQIEPVNVSCCLAVYSLGQATLELQCLPLCDEGDDRTTTEHTGHIVPFITV